MEPGCSVKGKSKPKTDRLGCSYLTIKKIILFKVLKTAQNAAKIC
jgi:hypothetical protein